MESQMRSPDELDAGNVLEQDSLASYRGYMCEEGKYNPMATLSFQGQEKTIKVLFVTLWMLTLRWTRGWICAIVQ